MELKKHKKTYFLFNMIKIIGKNSKINSVFLLIQIFFLSFRRSIYFLVPLIFLNILYSAETSVHHKSGSNLTNTSIKKEEDVAKASKSLGFLIGKKIKNSPIKLDQKKVFEGLKEALSSKKPTLTEKDCLASLVQMEEKIQNILAEKNLVQASLFLQQNAKHKETVVLQKNRLQYRILKPGLGKTVQEHFSPLIRYQGKLLNEEIFLPQEEQVVTVKELMPGLKKAIVGMQEKEKREIFIHPEIGYGKDNVLPPNSLLIFEVEVIKADKSELSQKPQEIAKQKVIK